MENKQEMSTNSSSSSSSEIAPNVASSLGPVNENEKTVVDIAPMGVITQKLIIKHQAKKLDKMQNDFQSNLHDKEAQIMKLRKSLAEMKELQIHNEFREKCQVSKDEIIAGLRKELKQAHVELERFKNETRKLIENIKETDLTIVLDNKQKYNEMKMVNVKNVEEIAHLKDLLREQENDIKEQEQVHRALLKTIKEYKKESLKYQIRINLKDDHLAKIAELNALLESKQELLQKQDQILMKKNKRIKELEDEIIAVLKKQSNMTQTKQELLAKNEQIELLQEQIRKIEVKEIKFDQMQKQY